MLRPFKRSERTPLLGWYGKLPVAGDFVARGLPTGLTRQVGDWFAEGMDQLASAGGEGWRPAYRLSPIWHFVMNRALWDERPLMGCVAPSQDRVGRCSPVLALRSIEPDRIEAALPPVSAWLYEVDELLRQVIADAMPIDSVLQGLDNALRTEMAQAGGDSAGQILTELGIAERSASPRQAWFSWPDLPELFLERQQRSFWWAEPSPKQPPRQIIHNGPPDAELFCLLMGGWISQ